MAELSIMARPVPTVAIVGLACRFPDADDAPELLDVVLTGRRAFRRIPPVRLDLADYYQPERTTSDATYSTRAALIADWRFDRKAFGVDRAAYAAADPAQWLALETAARALAGAGLTAGTGLDRDRTGVIVGNTLGGDVSRAGALRVRWPYVRRVLTDALSSEVPASQADAVLRRAERQYLAPFPVVGPNTLAGSTPAGIAAAISGYFGFRGASHAVDSAGSSSLLAIASACGALSAGDLDAVIAGGVDISLDPLEVIGLAKAGALATDDVRIYDESPTGYLPAEGCGMVVLMRTADARAAGLPVYAEIAGWGVSAAGAPGDAEAGLSSQLLAMYRAYERAQLDPHEVRFFEGNGAGTREDDEAELVALEVLRAGARQEAALGSVKANIGNARAAAGSASLIKTVLALSTGVVPPTTGVKRPHALINGGTARLELPPAAREWPAGLRIAACSALDSTGTNVHLVLRAEPTPARPERWSRLRGLPTRTLDGNEVTPRLMTAPGEPIPFLLHAQDRFALAGVLDRIASIARWLSDAELLDLACLLGREPSQQGGCRVAIVANGQNQLVTRAREAAILLPRLTDGLLTAQPGLFAADGADGRVTLLLSGQEADSPAALTEAVGACLETLRWLESLDVHPGVAVGHGLGALAGLAWAGVLGEGDVVEIAKLRAQFLDRSGADREPADKPAAPKSMPGKLAAVRLARPAAAGRAPDDEKAANPEPGLPAADGGLASVKRVSTSALRAAIAQKFRLGPPRRRLISTLTGAEITSVDDAIDLICSGFSGARKITDAVTDGAIGATVLFETGPGTTLAAVAAAATRVPAVGLPSGLADAEARTHAAAALFAAGAVDQAYALFAGWPARPIDIWRDRTFITSPCERRPQLPAPRAGEARADGPAATAPVAEEKEAAAIGPASAAAGTGSRARAAAADPAADVAEKGDEAAASSADDGTVLTAEPVSPPAEHVAESTTPGRAGQAAESGAADQSGAGQECGAARESGYLPHDEALAVQAQTSNAARAEPDGTAAASSEIELAQPEATETIEAGPAAELAAPDTAHSASADTGGPSAVPAEPDSGNTGSPAAGSAEAADADTPGLDDEGTPADARAGLSGVRDEIERKLPGRPLTGASIDSDEADGDGTAGPTMPGDPAADLNPAASWASCFGETLVPSAHAALDDNDRPWRTHIAGPGSVAIAAARSFRASPSAIRTLAIVGDPADEDSRAAALQAARDATTTGRLVVLTTSRGFTGFFASLQAEHPELGVTVLRVPNITKALRQARPFAHAVPGTFRELVLSPDGSLSEPALSQPRLSSGGPFPLGPEDVVLVSRGTRGAGLALAQVLACCGTPVAVIGRATDGDDSELVAGLEQLRSAGARIGYEVIDIADPASLTAAVERVEARLGPVTAIGHAVGPGLAVPLLELTDIEISDHVAGETATLDRLVESARPGQLRMIITFGSVAGRYGLAGATALALSSGALTGRAEQLAVAAANCRSLHVDLPAWSTGGLGDPPELADGFAAAGTAAIDVSAASRLLLKILTTAGLPDRLAIHGPVSGPAAPTAAAPAEAELAAAGLAGGARFVQDVRLYYPGAELICAPRLSLATDPYLADYHVDGLHVLPPGLALEALAQAASVLAGRPVRAATGVRLESPIVIPASGEAELRICARRAGTVVRAELNCQDSSFAVEHARAEFSLAETATPEPRRTKPPSAPSELPAAPSGLVDGAELYGPIAFQVGRFRRIALLPEVTARSCRALARAGDEQPWFEPDGPLAGAGFVLGSPGLNDAVLHALQASVPHRRVRPSGCESVTFSGKLAEGAVEIRAVAVPFAAAAGAAPAQLARGPEAASPTEAVSTEAATATREELNDQQPDDVRPRSRRGRRAQRRQSAAERQAERTAAAPTTPAHAPAAGTGGPRTADGHVVAVPAQPDAPAREQDPALRTAGAQRPDPVRLSDERWDVEAVDSAGDALVSWRGVELRDAGPLPRNAAWPPALLSVYLERGGRELGLDPGLRVTVSCGQPDGPGPQYLATAIPRQAPPGDGAPPADGTPAASDARPPRAAGAGSAGTSAAAATGTGHLAGFSLLVTAPVPVACGWTAVEPGHRNDQPPGMAAAYAQLRDQLAEPPANLAARLLAIGECLAAAGLRATEPVSCERTTADGWVVVRTATASVGCTVVDVSGVGVPVAIAILTGSAPVAAPQHTVRSAVAAEVGS